MPNIRTYTSNVPTPSPSGASSALVAQTGAAVSELFHSVGNTAETIGNFLDEQQGKHDVLALERQKADVFANLTDEWNRIVSQPGAAEDPKLAEKFRDEIVGPTLEAMGSDIGSTAGTKYRQQISDSLREHFFQKTEADAATLAGGSVTTTLNDYGNKTAATIYRDPSALEYAVKDADDLVNAQLATHPNISLTDREKIKTAIAPGLKNQFALSAFYSTAMSNPDQAKKDLASGRYDGLLSAEQLIAANKYLDGIHSEARTAAELNFQNVLDRIRQTGEDEGGAGIAIVNGITRRTPDETQTARTQARLEYDAAMQEGKVNLFVKDAPVDDLVAKHEELTERIKTAKPEDLRSLQAADAALIKLAKARDDAFFNDQVGYVQATSPLVQKALKGFNANPESQQAFDAYANAVMAAQKRLYPGVPPQIVSKAMADNLAISFASVTRDEQGAAQMAGILQRQAAVMGRYWPQAAQELYARKALNGTAFVAASLYGKPGAQSIAQDLIRAAVAQPKELIGPLKEADARSAAAGALGQFSATLGNAANGPELITAYEDALTNLLLYRSRISGEDIQDQADALAQQMVTGDYADAGYRVGLRIPAGKGIDADAVVAGSIAIRDTIETFNSGAKNFAPPGFRLSTKGLGIRQAGNLDPWNRPRLRNPDGSFSTADTISIGVDAGEVLIPTVVDGKRLSSADAIRRYAQTGENFGVFDTPQHAEIYAQKLHEAQASLYDKEGNALEGQIIVPPSYSGLGPNDQKKIYLQEIKTHGYWRTNSSGDGAILYSGSGAGDPVQVRRNGKIVPLEMTWAQLEAANRAVKAQKAKQLGPAGALH